ncbi:hypothetical protein DSM106972_091780 [Dulcicalothrix desertica PCC 7102]|uniref:Uncharacterized protein n=1 Tax=Dulcicalothrix desertica PCC 7102 TaxID=232991 RepID=A0A3S1ALM0_9CYAN|nr:hypothetical protein [Dulcicalothrix desertica]RUS94927.1 hypothetical protein DSM106972_091780 [Dulcicalothrix desertica PCC 7102]TWH62702.1 hypothetical protein CAL7102_00215 [Dulcicalothrix desertica PCC 7102]
MSDENIKRVKPIRKQMEYRNICFRITQLKNGNWKAVAGGVFVIAHTELDAIYYIKAEIDAELNLRRKWHQIL